MIGDNDIPDPVSVFHGNIKLLFPPLTSAQADRFL